MQSVLSSKSEAFLRRELARTAPAIAALAVALTTLTAIFGLSVSGFGGL